MPEADETDALDRKLDVLRDHADDWAELALDRRIAMARSLLDRTLETAAEQVELGVEAKGGEPSSAIEAEEWLAGPVVSARNIRLLVQTLEAIDEDGDPPIDPSDVRRRSDGGLAVEVFPDTLWDRLLYAGLSAEVWMRDDVRTYDELLESTAHFYREDEPDPGVALVLGAGNVASITPLDALYRLYAHGQTVLVKMNPVNDYLGPILEERFAEFIDAGFVRFAYGGAQVGDYLCRHDEVDAIHVTGSDRTHDAIVWGTGDEAQRRREQDDPRVDKPITSELGNVSPVVVLPGPWSSGDVDFHAANIASQLANNAGFNCNAARVLIRPEGWETGDRLVDGVESVLADVGTRPAYYPGARETFEEMTDDRDAVDRIGDPADGELPWAILRDLDPDADDPLYRNEPFCGIMGETQLAGDTPAAFLERAVDFCNETLWGTLNVCVIVHPETRRALGEALERAVARLQYGNIVLNHWPALSFSLGTTPWGAHPGHTRRDIQSGAGFVHNARLFERPLKSVLDGPFRMYPEPPWFVTNDAAPSLAPALAEFEAAPGPMKLLGILGASLG